MENRAARWLPALQIVGLKFELEKLKFARFSCTCMGFLWILQFTPTIQNHTVWLIGESELPSGFNVNGCVCQLVIDW